MNAEECLGVSKTIQPGVSLGVVFPMAELIQILTLERAGDDGLLVNFSDGTTAG